MGDPGREVDPDRPLDRHRLEHDASARAPDQDVGAETGTQRKTTARADIAAAQSAGADPRVLGEYGPGQGSGSGHADIKTDAPDPSFVNVSPQWVSRVE